jgi:hypothetical protein
MTANAATGPGPQRWTQGVAAHRSGQHRCAWIVRSPTTVAAISVTAILMNR